jgi:hypothetical protein
VFSRIIFEDWVEWTYRFPNDPVQSLLNIGLNLRNNLARSIQNHAIIVGRLQLLQEISFYSCTRDITNIENKYYYLDTLYYVR